VSLVHLVLDVQHAGRRSRPGDTGASFDLDGDGVRSEQGEREVDLVEGYVAAAVERCGELQIDVSVLRIGEYSRRHESAIRIAKQVQAGRAGRVAYLACHTNAGRGGYGLVRPDCRSGLGARLAAAIAAGLSRLPELQRPGGLPGCRVEPLYPSGGAAMRAGRDTLTAAAVAWHTRGWGCIDGIFAGPANLAGVLVEPGFLDSPAHRSLWTPEGLRRVGRAIVDGARGWE
jgi:hypothetical protein